MGLLEDALRQTFANQVATPPGTEGLADRAIRQAGGIRRRRLASASVMAVVSLVFIGVGGFAIRDALYRSNQFQSDAIAPAAVPELSPEPLVGVKLPVDVVNGDRIQVADGRVVSLAGLGTVDQALRVAPGWLVQTTESLAKRSSVWLVDERGFAAQLAAGESTMVSPGTTSRPDPQVAWVSAGRLTVSNFVGDALTGTTSTPGATDLVPVRAIGAGILLSAAGAWDMWFPDKGAYRPTTTTTDLAVLGTTVGRDRLIAIYTAKNGCLTEVEPVEFAVARSTCQLRLAADDRVYQSPGGDWWLVVTPAAVDVYSASTFWLSATPAFSVPVDAATSGAWLDDATFVVLGRSDVMQVSMRDRRVQATVKVPESGAAGAHEVVVDAR